MTFIIKNGGPAPQLESEIIRLRGLVQALDDIRRGRHPDGATLASCPKLHDWQVIRRPDPCLTGVMFNHPHIPDGRPGVTTGLWVLAPDLGYARTMSRYYALGRQDRGAPLPILHSRT
jgi:hypothetical protein